MVQHCTSTIDIPLLLTDVGEYTNDIIIMVKEMKWLAYSSRSEVKYHKYWGYSTHSYTLHVVNRAANR